MSGCLQTATLGYRKMPLVMLAVHSDDEKAATERFQLGAARDLARYVIVRQRATTKRLAMLSTCFASSSIQPLTRSLPKAEHLYLHDAVARKPNFVSPFWVALAQPAANGRGPMVRNADGTVIKGFMKASVAVGFCPIACPYCLSQHAVH